MAFTPETISIIVQPIGGVGMRFVSYRTDDVQATLTATDYFANSERFGIKLNDLIFVSPISTDFDAYILVVTAIDADGNVTASINEEEMLKSVYDPQGIAGDAFDRANHTGTQEIADTLFKIVDDGDPTKKLAFQVSGISEDTTRTWTVPDVDVTVTSAGAALLDDADADAQLVTVGGGTTGVNVFKAATALEVRTLLAPSIDGTESIATLKTNIDPTVVRQQRVFTGQGRGIWQSALYADWTALMGYDTNNIVITRSTFNSDYVWLRYEAYPWTGAEVKLIWALKDGETDISTALYRVNLLGIALGRTGSIGSAGMLITLPPGDYNSVFWGSVLSSNMTIRGAEDGITKIIVNASTQVNTPIWRTAANAGATATGSYVHENVIIENITFDASARPTNFWLSKADRTPVTDPEADYVMGTGALASGISGVDITCSLTSGKVTGTTIVNGGAGWNAHPTKPYIPSTVRLRFEGGSPRRKAVGYGTIVGGTITSITIEDPGLGYSTAPAVYTCGGYADPTLLYDPSVDRRNNLSNTQVNEYAIQLTQVDGGAVRNCTFINCMRTVGIFGCKDLPIHNNRYIDCGDPVGIRAINFVSDYVVGGTGTTETRRCNVYDNISYAVNKLVPGIFLYYTIAGGGKVYNNNVKHGSFMQTGTAPTRGFIHCYGNEISEVIPNQSFEGGGGGHVVFENNYIHDCNGQAFGVYHGHRREYRGNVYQNMWRESADYWTMFSSANERATEYPGAMPKVFTQDGYIYGQNGMVVFGNNSGAGSIFTTMDNETIIDNRTAADDVPAYLNSFSAGSLNNSKYAELSRVKRLKTDRSINADIQLVAGGSKDNTMDVKYPMWVHDNPGHASESNKTVVQSFAASSNILYTISPGFTPRVVHVYGRCPTALTQTCLATWTRDTSTATGWKCRGLWAVAGSAVGADFTTPAIELRNAAGTVRFSANFTKWLVAGFSVTVTTSLDAADVTFVCEV